MNRKKLLYSKKFVAQSKKRLFEQWQLSGMGKAAPHAVFCHVAEDLVSVCDAPTGLDVGGYGFPWPMPRAGMRGTVGALGIPIPNLGKIRR